MNVISCHTCVSKCCRYFALQLDTPRSREAFEDIRWFLAHKGVSVYIEKKKWYLEVDQECQFLTKDHKCSIYDKRPLICREHDPSSCESKHGEFDHEITFRSLEEFDKYLSKRFKRKRRKK